MSVVTNLFQNFNHFFRSHNASPSPTQNFILQPTKIDIFPLNLRQFDAKFITLIHNSKHTSAKQTHKMLEFIKQATKKSTQLSRCISHGEHLMSLKRASHHFHSHRYTSIANFHEKGCIKMQS